MPQSLIYNTVLLTFLRGQYAADRHGAKRLAGDARVSPRTAENWLTGACAPMGQNLLSLMIACPPLETAISETVAARRAALREQSAAAARSAAFRWENRNEILEHGRRRGGAKGR